MTISKGDSALRVGPNMPASQSTIRIVGSKLAAAGQWKVPTGHGAANPLAPPPFLVPAPPPKPEIIT